MIGKAITSYLNDQMAGSVIAFQILDSLLRRQSGSTMTRGLNELKNELIDDRLELEKLMDRLKISTNRSRKTAAWFSEKLFELKEQVDDPSGQLFLLEALDTLSMGIEGKTLLWRALEAAAVPGLEYSHLIQRAEAQRKTVEKMRIEAARSALGNTTLHEE